MKRAASWFLAGLLLFGACKRDPARPAAPARGEAVYVWEPNAVLVEGVTPEAREIERLPIGKAIGVERVAGSEHYVKVVAGTKKPGFVLARAVRAGRPTVEGSLAAAREALARGDLGAAELESLRAVLLAGSHGSAALVEVVDMREAIGDARGDADLARAERARRKRLALPAPTATPDAAPVSAKPAKPGDERWVSATTLLLKSKPDVTARTVGELPIDTKVTVESVHGEWLVVRAAVATAPVLVLRGETVEELGADDRDARGYARPRFLADHPLDAKALLAEADALEAKGDLPEAVRRLERAAALSPSRDLVARIARVATRAKLYRVAARAGVKLGSAAVEEVSETLHEGEVWGCRGDLSKAVIVGMERADGAPPDACITGPEFDECAPCGPSGIELLDLEERATDEYISRELGDEEIGDDEERQARFDEIRTERLEELDAARQRIADEEAATQVAMEEWQQRHDAWAATRDELREKFPEGPFVITTLPADPEGGEPWFAWTRSVQVLDDYCGNLLLGWSGLDVSLPIEARATVDRTLWIRMGERPDRTLWGVERAPDPETVEARIAGDRSGCDENPYGPGCAPDASQFPSLQPCGCCGC